MINYYLRPDQTQVKIDSDAKTITNIVNKSDQKIIGHFIGDAYYTRVSTDAVSLGWSTSNETDYNTAKISVLTYLNSI
jgi:hypothetical protein